MSKILELCREIPTRTFEPGTVLFAEGKKSGVLCILVDGQVEILKGEFEVSTISDPGAVFGEMSILLNLPHTATVKARTPCRVHMINDGDAFLRTHKDVAYDLLKIVAERLHAVTTYLADLNRYVRAV